MSNELRCRKCNKKLGANLEGEVAIVCPRCGVYNRFSRVCLTNPEVSARVSSKR